MPEDTAEYIPFEEFRNGLPFGRFRVVVDPVLARRYVTQRLHLLAVSGSIIGVGVLLALAGNAWAGGALVLVGIAGKRLVQARAPKVLLQMAVRDPAVYGQATSQGVFEVQRSA